MTLNDILTLAKAGYSAAQIAKLGSTAPAARAAMQQGTSLQTAPMQLPTQAQTPVTLQDYAPSLYQAYQPLPAVGQAYVPPLYQAPAPAPAPTPAPGYQQQLDSMASQINMLTTTLQAQAMMSDNQPYDEVTADDVLANIIDPPGIHMQNGMPLPGVVSK